MESIGRTEVTSFEKAISIIIPTLNEASHLDHTLQACRDSYVSETIVVDAGSVDSTGEVARALGASVHISKPGKSHQLNTGARRAKSDCLLFLHADTVLPAGFGREVVDLLSNPETVAGAFRLGIDGAAPILRWIEQMANWRSRWRQLPYGDQAVFMKKSTFVASGGFDSNLPIMEDYELIRRLRRRGRIALSRLQVQTSARRWNAVGPWRTTLVNQLLIIGFHAGIDPERLRRFYYLQNRRSSRLVNKVGSV